MSYLENIDCGPTKYGAVQSYFQVGVSPDDNLFILQISSENF